MLTLCSEEAFRLQIGPRKHLKRASAEAGQSRTRRLPFVYKGERAAWRRGAARTRTQIVGRRTARNPPPFLFRVSKTGASAARLLGDGSPAPLFKRGFQPPPSFSSPHSSSSTHQFLFPSIPPSVGGMEGKMKAGMEGAFIFSLQAFGITGGGEGGWQLSQFCLLFFSLTPLLSHTRTRGTSSASYTSPMSLQGLRDGSPG